MKQSNKWSLKQFQRKSTLQFQTKTNGGFALVSVLARPQKQLHKTKRQAKNLLDTRTGLLFSFTFVCLPSL
jgi:hypothetical protein